jgi:2-C-methyl-D-erythritol 4-phosphate cytidylyltransferase
MSTIPFLSVIILAGGIGSRMKSAVPKQFLILDDKPLALYSFEIFSSMEEIKEIIVVCDPSYAHLFSSSKPVKFAPSGERRQDSLQNGLKKISPKTELVMIHDSARPFISLSHVQELIHASLIYGAVSSAVPMKYTIKECDKDGFVLRTLDRSKLWEIHTPQIASVSVLKQGLELASQKNLTVTDDMSLVELTGQRVKLIPGSSRNLKITTPEDWELAQSLVKSQHAQV